MSENGWQGRSWQNKNSKPRMPLLRSEESIAREVMLLRPFLDDICGEVGEQSRSRGVAGFRFCGIKGVKTQHTSRPPSRLMALMP